MAMACMFRQSWNDMTFLQSNSNVTNSLLVSVLETLHFLVYAVCIYKKLDIEYGANILCK